MPRHSLRRLDRLTTVIVAVLALIHLGSYFLPFEHWGWSPYEMSKGYGAGGSHMSGAIDVSNLLELPASPQQVQARALRLHHTLPYAVGLVVVGALVFQRAWRLATVVLGVFAATWLTAAMTYVVFLLKIPGLVFASVWLWIAAGAAAMFVTLLLVGLVRGAVSQRSVIVLSLLLSAGLIVDHGATIAFCLLEDGLLLNYGAVTSSVAAVGLFLTLLFKGRLQKIATESVLATPAGIAAGQAAEIPDAPDVLAQATGGRSQKQNGGSSRSPEPLGEGNP